MGQFISFKSKINNPWFNPWFILLHTHSNVCATVEGRCLEYLVCITLDSTSKSLHGIGLGTVFVKILKCLSLSLSAYLCIDIYWLSWLGLASHRKLIQNAALRLRRFKILTCPLLLDSLRISLESFRSFRGLLPHWPAPPQKN